MMNKALLFLLALLACLSARADYPDRAVTLVVPFSAGGPTDRVARDLAQAMQGPLGAEIRIEIVGGAGGTWGATKVAKAAPDGYTLLLHHIGMATSPALYRNLPYRTLEDFEFLGMINEVPMTLIGRPGLPARNHAELSRWLQANRGRAILANAGLGSASHLCGLLYQSMLNLDLHTVRFKGTGPAMNDLLGGQVDIMCDQTTNTAGLIQSGKVRAYAVTTLKPLGGEGLAGLPTLDALGLAGFNVTIWHGLYAPAGTPRPVLQRITAALRSALANPEFRRREEALGAVIIADERNDSAGHKRFVKAEIARWAPIIKSAGQYAD